MTTPLPCKAVPLRKAISDLQTISPNSLPISRATVYRLLDKGEGPATARRIGSRIFVSVNDLKLWAESLGTSSASTEQK